MTHAERVLRLFSDFKPHSHHEGYALGVILHSRVADLRRQGHVIRSWRDGDSYFYQLVSSPLGDAACLPSQAASPGGAVDGDSTTAAGVSSFPPAPVPLETSAVAVDRPASPAGERFGASHSEAERQLRIDLVVAA